MNIVIIGSGNIGTHYANAFFNLKHKIIQVFSKTSANAKALADTVFAKPIDNLLEIDPTADLYIIAVADQYITEVVQHLNKNIKGIVVHTSGATSMNVLDKFNNHGVIYPPQSLNKSIDTDLSKIPFAIEASNEESRLILTNLMTSISPLRFYCDSKQRLALHVAAVFVNNFSNALFDMAYSILEKQNLDFELLKPIIMETAKKVQSHHPQEVQTGPASRNDNNTINTHLQFLSYSNDLTEIYQSLSNFIIKRRLK